MRNFLFVLMGLIGYAWCEASLQDQVESNKEQTLEVAQPQQKEKKEETPMTKQEDNATPKAEAQTPKLVCEDLKEGSGDLPKKGDTLVVHYIGKLTNGKVFDSSYGRGTPFQFTLGAGQVIKGWDEGLATMKKGGRRILTIPSDLGYGVYGAPPRIPGNATLIFEVELVDIVR